MFVTPQHTLTFQAIQVYFRYTFKTLLNVVTSNLKTSVPVKIVQLLAIFTKNTSSNFFS